MKKRFLGCLLAVALVATMTPAMVFGAEESGQWPVAGGPGLEEQGAVLVDCPDPAEDAESLDDEGDDPAENDPLVITVLSGPEPFAAATRTTRLDLTADSVTYAGGAGEGNPAAGDIVDSAEGWKWYRDGVTVDAVAYTGLVLVLDGLVLETDEAIALKVPSYTTIAIADSSENEITSTYSGKGESSGIFAQGYIYIKGVGGSLTAAGGDPTGSDNTMYGNGYDRSYAINVYELSITGDATVYAKGGKASYESYGIKVQGPSSGYLTITDAEVHATGAAVSLGGCGIYVSNGNVTINGHAKLNVSGGNAVYANGSSGSGNITINGTAKVEARGRGGDALHAGNMYTSGGRVAINGDAVVTAIGGDNPTGSSYAIYGGCNDYYENNISIGGNATVNATGGAAKSGSYALYSQGALVIGGDATVTATGGESDENTGYGLCSRGNTSISGSPKIEATGDYGLSTMGYSLNITAPGTLDLTLKGNIRAIASDYTVPLGYRYWTNDTTLPPADLSAKAAKKSDGTAAYSLTKTDRYAKIIPPESFTLYFMDGGDDWGLYKEAGGETKYDGEGETWSASGNTLTLSGFVFYTTAGTALNMPAGGKIMLEGGNTIRTTGNSSTSYYAINSAGALSIDSADGSGRLAAISGVGIYTASGLTVSGGTVNATGGTAASCHGIIGGVSVSGGILNAKAGSGNNCSGISGAVNVSGGFLNATGGTGATCYGVYGALTITGGELTAKGITRAIYITAGSPYNYTVPDGYAYKTADNTAGANPLAGKSDGTFEIIASHKYAKIFGVESYVLNLYPDGKLYKTGSADVTNEMAAKGAAVTGSAGAWVLNLTDFDFATSASQALSLPAGTTVSLAGNSTLTSVYTGTNPDSSWSGSYGIYSSGNLFITSESSGALLVTGGSTIHALASRGIYSGGSLEIGGSANLTAIGGPTSNVGNSGGLSGHSSGVETDSYIILRDSANLNATGGEVTGSSESRGICSPAGDIKIQGGVFTAKGNDRAISYNYSVPPGYNYSVADNTAGTSPTAGISDGDFEITSAHKYCKMSIEYTLYLNGSDGALRVNDYDGMDVTDIMAAMGAVVSGSSGARVLTLTDFNFTTNAARALELYGGTEIVLEGDNSFVSGCSTVSSTYGIYSNGNISITSNTGGCLTASGSVSVLNTQSYGIFSYYNISIEGAAVDATGGATTSGSSGIYAQGAITIFDSTVNARGGAGTGASRGIYCQGPITIDESTVNAIGGTGTGYGYGIYSYSNISPSIKDSVVTAKGAARAIYNTSYAPNDYTVPSGHKYWVAEDASNTIGQQSGTSDGSFKVTENHKYAKLEAPTPENPDYILYLNNSDGKLRKTNASGINITGKMAALGATVSGGVGAWVLTLNNFGFTTTANYALEVPGNTEIVLVGQNSLKSLYSGAGSYTRGITTSGNLKISSATGGSLAATSGSISGDVFYGACGIYANSGMTIEGCTVNANGGQPGDNSSSYSYGLYAYYGVTIENSKVTATGDTRAIMNYSNWPSYGYTVPDGCAYTVANNKAGMSPTSGVSDGTFEITEDHKYAEIQHGTGGPGNPGDAPKPLYALSLAPGHVILEGSSGSVSAKIGLVGNTLVTDYDLLGWSAGGAAGLYEEVPGSGNWGVDDGGFKPLLRIEDMDDGIVRVTGLDFSVPRTLTLWARYGGYSASATIEILASLPAAGSDTIVKVLESSITVNRAKVQGTTTPVLITQNKDVVKALADDVGTTGVGALRLVTDGSKASPKALENFAVSVWPADNRYIEIKALNANARSTNKVSLQALPIGTPASAENWADKAVQIETVGTFNIKVTNSYPKVTVKAADLNLAFPTVAMPLAVAGAGGAAVELVGLDEAAAKKVRLNKADSTLSLVLSDGKPVQGSGAVLSGKLTVKQAGYHEQTLGFKVKVVAAASAAAMPKVKLDRSSVSLYYTAVPGGEAAKDVINVDDLRPVVLSVGPAAKGALLEDAWYAIKDIMSTDNKLEAVYKGGGKVAVSPLSGSVPKKVKLRVVFFDPADTSNDKLFRDLTLNVKMVNASGLKAVNKATSVSVNKEHNSTAVRDVPITLNVHNLVLEDWDVIDAPAADKNSNTPAWGGNGFGDADDWRDAIVVANDGSGISITANKARLDNLVNKHDSTKNAKYTMKIGSPKLNKSAGKDVAFKLTLNIVKSAAGMKLAVDKKAKLDIANPFSAARVKVALVGTSSGIAEVRLYESLGKTASAEPSVVHTGLAPVFEAGALSFDIVAKDQAAAPLAPAVKNNLSVWVKLENGQEIASWSEGKKNGTTVYNDKLITITPVQTVQKGWKAGAALYKAQPLAGSPVHGVTLTRPAGVTTGEVQLNMKKLKALRFAVPAAEDEVGARKAGDGYYKQVDGFEIKQNGPDEWTIYFKDGVCPARVFSSDFRKVGNLKSSYKADLQIWAEGTYLVDEHGAPVRDANGDLKPLGSGKKASKPTVVTLTVTIN